MKNSMFMRVMDRSRHLRNEFYRGPNRHRLAASHFVELAVNELHAEVARAIALTNFVDRNDTGMLQPGGSLCFKAKALQVGFARPLTKANYFQGNSTVETLLSRAKYHALTASPDFFQQFVIAQFSEQLRGARGFLVVRRSILISS
ncbi:MAG TPA: hypothetical protein VGM65_16665 [Candidatus Udaeobacter sp.]